MRKKCTGFFAGGVSWCFFFFLTSALSSKGFNFKTKNNHMEHFIGIVMVGVIKVDNRLGMRLFRLRILALSPQVTVTHETTHDYFLIIVSLTIK